LVVEPRLAAWRDALGDWAGTEPVLAGSGSTWFVRADDASGARATAGGPHELRVGSEAGLLVHARTVPAGWEGD
jgi:hypothetical protein